MLTIGPRPLPPSRYFSLVRIDLILVVLVTLAAAHPSSGSFQQSLTSIHNGRRPFVLASHFVCEPMRRRGNAADVAVDINALPIALGDMVRLMVDTEMRILLDVLVPPVPPVAVIFRMSEFVQSLRSPEVPDLHDLVVGRAVAVINPASHAQKAKFLGMRLEILYHLWEIASELSETRCEETQWMIAACTDKKYNDIAVCRLATVLAFLVRELCAELLLNHFVHVDVVLQSDGHGVRVKRSVEQDGYCRYESKSAANQEEQTLGDGSETEPCRDGEIVTDELKRC